MRNLVKYVGMDVHKSTTVIVVLNARGQFEMQAIIKTNGAAFLVQSTATGGKFTSHHNASIGWQN